MNTFKTATRSVPALMIFMLAALTVAVDAQAQPAAPAVQAGATNEALLAAYQREFVYLDNEIRLLTQRLSAVNADGESRLDKARAELRSKEATLLEVSADVDRRDRQLQALLDEEGDKIDAGDTLRSIVQQADSRLRRVGPPMAQPELPSTATEGERLAASVTASFTNAIGALGRLSAIRAEEGRFFLEDGKEASGTIVKIGQVAALGVSDEGSGTLAPAGDGRLRLVDAKSADVARTAAQDPSAVEQLPIFLYSSLDEMAETRKGTTFRDKVKGGGPIGVIILILGAVGFVLVGIRAVLLWIASGRTAGLDAVVDSVSKGDWAAAKEKAGALRGALGRVIRATLDGLERAPDTIEDVIAEAVLDEQPTLDIFRQIISVFAAVAPLLGLLGTVTGMIATFDIITQFGTGDPKLLSGGISEALITTEFGLEVAIPTLLMGNLLASWADRITGTVEISALRLVNARSFNGESAVAAS